MKDRQCVISYDTLLDICRENRAKLSMGRVIDGIIDTRKGYNCGEKMLFVSEE